MLFTRKDPHTLLKIRLQQFSHVMSSRYKLMMHLKKERRREEKEGPFLDKE